MPNNLIQHNKTYYTSIARINKLYQPDFFLESRQHREIAEIAFFLNRSKNCDELFDFKNLIGLKFREICSYNNSVESTLLNAFCSTDVSIKERKMFCLFAFNTIKTLIPFEIASFSDVVYQYINGFADDGCLYDAFLKVDKIKNEVKKIDDKINENHDPKNKEIVSKMNFRAAQLEALNCLKMLLSTNEKLDMYLCAVGARHAARHFDIFCEYSKDNLDKNTRDLVFNLNFNHFLKQFGFSSFKKDDAVYHETAFDHVNQDILRMKNALIYQVFNDE